MKKLFTFVLVSVVTFGLQAQTANNGDASGPEIKFEKTSHNFGEVKEGKKAKYEFKFTNTGDEPLVIKNVNPSCGCTTSDEPKEPIKPGETETIEAIYNSQGRPGNFHKSITVKSNAKSNSTQVLSIQGNVVTEN